MCHESRERRRPSGPSAGAVRGRTGGPRLVVALLWALGICSVDAVAVEPAVAQEAMILMKVLGYDRRLEPSARPVVVMVLDGHGTPTERRACAAFGEALELAATQISIRGRRVDVRRHDWVDGATFGQALLQEPTNLVLVCDALRGEAGAIAAVSHGARVLTACLRRDLVDESLAVAIVRNTTRVEIVVNLPAAEASGSSFGSDLLQLATVVR
jgi:hypothetical protein